MHCQSPDPPRSVIDGIEVLVERRSAAGTVFDAAARIVKGGIVGATDRSIVGTWSTVDTIVTYGSNSDLWGEGWTATDINSASFGFALSVDDSVDTAAVDQIRATVYYSLCGDSQVGLSEDCDDGNSVDSDACTNACTTAACGDGIVQEGVEPCDDGNDDPFDACTNDRLQW